MRKYLSLILWFTILAVSGYYTYISTVYLSDTVSRKVLFENAVYIFTFGFSLSALIYNLLYKKLETALNMYKRGMEKESIDKTESSSRIKVLESKIEVLEKALEEALKK
mgnify:CR=1 FL=1